MDRLSSCSRCFSLSLFLAILAISHNACAQQFLLPVEMQGQQLRGKPAVSLHENDGVIGLEGEGTPEGYKVLKVTPEGPSAKAGILPGETLVSLDGLSLRAVGTSEALKPICAKKQGELVILTIVRNGTEQQITVVADVRKHLYANDPAWQSEFNQPPAVIQRLFGETAAVGAALSETSQDPTKLSLAISLHSYNAPQFRADDLKFFVIDGTGQQLKRVSLDEIKYGLELIVAQNWKGGNYPPPPPPSPQRQYTIEGTGTGNYTLTSLGGGMASMSGTTSSTYTVTQQPDYNQLGYSLGMAIRRYRDQKSDKKLLQQAREAYSSWDRTYFKAQSPILPGETRNGQILYWTGTDRRPQPPFRVVLFLNDPRTQQEEGITFAFGQGAEKIRDEMAKHVSTGSTPSSTAVPLSNTDVLGMLKRGISPEIIIAKIKNSQCSFDTSPATLNSLKDDGIPDAVLLAMVEAPVTH